MKVHEALSAVMADVQEIRKEGRNTHQGYNFRGVDGVMNAVGPAFRKHNVLCLPRVLKASYRDFEAKSGGTQHECIIEVEFTFVGPEGDTLVCSAMGEASDASDKATSQAHSVAYRTALLQALCVPTDAPDPDESSVQRGAEEIIPAAEAKTRLLNASNREIAEQVWGSRGSEAIGALALSALVDVAGGMKKQADRKAAASGEGEAP